METTQTYQLKPGYLVIPNISAAGGVRSDKEEISFNEVNEGQGIEKTYKINTVIDNVQLKSEANSLANAARYALRSASLETPIGYYCSEDTLTKVKESIEKYSLEANRFNTKAWENNSAVRVTVRLTVVPLSAAGPECAQEMFAAIRDRLGKLVHYLTHAAAATTPEADRAKARKKSNELLNTEAKNLDQLAAGMLRFSVQDAIEAARASYKELTEAAKESREPSINVEPIEAAIAMFTDIDFNSVELS